MQNNTKGAGSSLVSDDVSRAWLATLGKWTGGLSPQAFGGAWLNVLARMASAPGRQAAVARSALQKSFALAQFAGTAIRGGQNAPEAQGTPYANRFADPAWAKFPFNVLAQTFITASDVAREAVKNVPGADPAAENIVGFTVREGLELVAPDNYLPTNPQLIGKTMEEKGRNLVRGVKHLGEDVVRTLRGQGPVGVENYVVGEQIAATRGKVILRTPLMELIQYAPQTKSVYAEPVLIVPAWIMKYYILDLSPQNSLVNYLTGLGHTVFMVSWKNPTAEDRDITMDDYLASGVFAALDAVGAVVPKRRIHAVGYCIGGTLLAIAAAALAAKDDERLASVTMFAAQTDFSEPGELSIFISPAQLAMLEAMMWKEGVLESRQMGGAFQLLRTYDLLWAPTIGTYLRGERLGVNDLMAWNADGTRMAYRMHTDYLHQLYLNNDLAEDRYTALGETISLVGHHRADVRRRHRDGPRGAMALGVQGRPARALHRLHVLPHERRSQRRHHQWTAASEAKASRAADEVGRATAVAGPLPGESRAGAGLVVADLGEVAGGALGRAQGAAARDGRAEEGTEADLRRTRNVRQGEVISRGSCGSVASRSRASRRGRPATWLPAGRGR